MPSVQWSGSARRDAHSAYHLLLQGKELKHKESCCPGPHSAHILLRRAPTSLAASLWPLPRSHGWCQTSVPAVCLAVPQKWLWCRWPLPASPCNVTICAAEEVEGSEPPRSPMSARPALVPAGLWHPTLIGTEMGNVLSYLAQITLKLSALNQQLILE